MRPLCETSTRSLSLEFVTNEQRRRRFNTELNIRSANQIAEEVIDRRLKHCIIKIRNDFHGLNEVNTYEIIKESRANTIISTARALSNGSYS